MKRLFLFAVLLILFIWVMTPGAKTIVKEKAASNSSFAQSSSPSDIETKNLFEKKSRKLVGDDDLDLVPIEELLKGTGGSQLVYSEPTPNADASSQAGGVIVYDNRYGASNGLSNYGYEDDVAARYGGNSGYAELDALREAEQFLADNYRSGFYGGARASKDSNNPVDETVKLPVKDPTPTPVPTLKPVTGQSRGYAMLYLMHPKARQTVERQLDAMIESKVMELYLGVLVDGTFEKDFSYLSNVVRRISRAGRELTLVLYLTNGAYMRDPLIERREAPFSGINPDDFRFLIQNDVATQDEFTRLVRPTLPALQLNLRSNPGNKNYIVVMLEDNLDDDSYLTMRDLAEPIIGDRAEFIRNPCPGCWEGNTVNGFGDGVEIHNSSAIDLLGLRDAFTLDGIGYSLPDEENTGQPTFEEVKEFAIQSAGRGFRYFGLWRFERQGLKFGQGKLPAVDRSYEVPSPSDIKAEIELLRAGLTEAEN